MVFTLYQDYCKTFVTYKINKRIKNLKKNVLSRLSVEFVTCINRVPMFASMPKLMYF